MSTDRQSYKIFLATVCFFFATFFCTGQADNTKLNPDSSKTISKVAFDNLVDTCIKLLQTKQLLKITDSGHIDIMMCLNTILVRQLTGGRYDKLKTIANEKNYTKDIIKIYPDWIPNKGMGFYFPKLKMELYGTPRLYAVFNVTK